MKYIQGSQDETGLIFLVVISFLFIILMVFYLNVVVPFKQNRKYIKMEMARTSGSEYHYWKRELTKLYLIHIPIVRIFVRKYMR